MSRAFLNFFTNQGDVLLHIDMRLSYNNKIDVALVTAQFDGVWIGQAKGEIKEVVKPFPVVNQQLFSVVLTFVDLDSFQVSQNYQKQLL